MHLTRDSVKSGPLFLRCVCLHYFYSEGPVFSFFFIYFPGDLSSHITWRIYNCLTGKLFRYRTGKFCGYHTWYHDLTWKLFYHLIGKLYCYLTWKICILVGGFQLS